ncbi:MAG: Arc family DNA-binding protein [gamma proteobacterium endosymbiont of Lamellibrachia anaximandri]|nr:Arc family DNA-binding protein [gamma proteobacterium endosymbiont of Lamellibrachia anaximandri]MBL3535700.1 Arc family DNA-binding protein [gamma proteobacterium endosymbiont of Lamellibrachia anaximandri]
MSKEIKKTALRLPKNLHAKIIQAAEESGHSMKSEIIARLSDSFGQEDDVSESIDALDAVNMTQERLVSALYRRLFHLVRIAELTPSDIDESKLSHYLDEFNEWLGQPSPPDMEELFSIVGRESTGTKAVLAAMTSLDLEALTKAQLIVFAEARRNKNLIMYAINQFEDYLAANEEQIWKNSKLRDPFWLYNPGLQEKE